MTQSNPLVRENTGRVAVERGPLVYCLEQPDQSGVRSLFEVALATGPGRGFREEFRKDLLGGVMLLRHAGAEAEKPLADGPLYPRLGYGGDITWKPADLTLIPYYAWANRGPKEMEVWIPYTPQP